MSDFDFEPVPGLPETLPEGERLLWQGSPSWPALARTAFHVRGVAFYFALLIGWSFALALWNRQLGTAWAALPWLLGLGFAAIAILLGLAWATGRTTIYTVTSRRVVIRYGIALPLTLNLPFKVIGSAALRLDDDGTGDIPLALSSGDRIAWLVMWPHVRPWRLGNAEPMLRAIPDAASVAKVLARAMEAAQPLPVQPSPVQSSVPAREATPVSRGLRQPRLEPATGQVA